MSACGYQDLWRCINGFLPVGGLDFNLLRTLEVGSAMDQLNVLLAPVALIGCVETFDFGVAVLFEVGETEGYILWDIVAVMNTIL